MVEGFDDGQSADAAMSDDLEQENSRLRAQEDNEQLDTAPVGCTGPEVGTMGKWLATRQEARELPGVSTDSDVQGLLTVWTECARNWWPQGDSKWPRIPSISC